MTNFKVFTITERKLIPTSIKRLLKLKETPTHKSKSDGH